MEAFSVVRQIWFGETFSFLAKPDLSITIVVYIYTYVSLNRQWHGSLLILGGHAVLTHVRYGRGHALKLLDLFYALQIP